MKIVHSFHYDENKTMISFDIGGTEAIHNKCCRSSETIAAIIGGMVDNIFLYTIIISLQTYTKIEN